MTPVLQSITTLYAHGYVYVGEWIEDQDADGFDAASTTTIQHTILTPEGSVIRPPFSEDTFPSVQHIEEFLLQFVRGRASYC